MRADEPSPESSLSIYSRRSIEMGAFSGHSLQRSSLELYRQHSINPWSPLLGLIPAVIEIALIVLLYVASASQTLFRRLLISVGLSDLSSRDPRFVLAGLMGLLLILQNRFKLLLQTAVPVG